MEPPFLAGDFCIDGAGADAGVGAGAGEAEGETETGVETLDDSCTAIDEFSPSSKFWKKKSWRLQSLMVK